MRKIAILFLVLWFALPQQGVGSNSTVSFEECDCKLPRISRKAPCKSVQEMVAYAKRYMGVRYKTGGTSPQTGFDCSGFTAYCYKQLGVTLPRTSKEQAKAGKSTRKYAVGDLVFFRGSKGRKVGHVGIVVKVHGRSFDFIHATLSNGIMINKSSDAYYKKRFISARRYVKNKRARR